MPAKTPNPHTTADPTEIWTKLLADLGAARPGSPPWLNGAAAEVLADMGADWVQFVADRVREDVKTQHAILQCRDAGELAHIQEAFLQRAVDDYAAQTGRMVQMGSGVLAALIRGKADETT